MEPLIRVKNMYKIYNPGENEVRALDDVSLEINQGEFIAIVGHSGSGKSTFMNMLGCLDTPDSGEYFLDGKDVANLSDNELSDIRNHKIGFIFQAHNLLPFLTAAENVSLVLDLAGWAPEKGKERAKELLDYLEVGHRAPVKPALLSGGEAQRVAIARALANRPRIILADEPTAALDSKRAQLVMDLLRKLAAEQEACILTVTHDEKIFDRFDRLIHLRDGKLADE